MGTLVTREFASAAYTLAVEVDWRLFVASSAKQKSAMDSLLETFGQVIDSGARNKNESELKESEKKFNDVVDRAVGARKPRRETA